MGSSLQPALNPALLQDTGWLEGPMCAVPVLPTLRAFRVATTHLLAPEGPSQEVPTTQAAWRAVTRERGCARLRLTPRRM